MTDTLMMHQAVADFQLTATSGKTFKLSDYLGKNLVIYFYPKDSTPAAPRKAYNSEILMLIFKQIIPKFLVFHATA